MNRYSVILDVIALTHLYPKQAEVLSRATQREALLYLNGAPAKKLALLLKIASDLGYLDSSVHEILAKLLKNA